MATKQQNIRALAQLRGVSIAVVQQFGATAQQIESMLNQARGHLSPAQQMQAAVVQIQQRPAPPRRSRSAPTQQQKKRSLAARLAREQRRLGRLTKAQLVAQVQTARPGAYTRAVLQQRTRASLIGTLKRFKVKRATTASRALSKSKLKRARRISRAIKSRQIAAKQGWTKWSDATGDDKRKKLDNFLLKYKGVTVPSGKPSKSKLKRARQITRAIRAGRLAAPQGAETWVEYGARLAPGTSRVQKLEAFLQNFAGTRIPGRPSARRATGRKSPRSRYAAMEASRQRMAPAQRQSAGRLHPYYVAPKKRSVVDRQKVADGNRVAVVRAIPGSGATPFRDLPASQRAAIVRFLSNGGSSLRSAGAPRDVSTSSINAGMRLGGYLEPRAQRTGWTPKKRGQMQLRRAPYDPRPGRYPGSRRSQSGPTMASLRKEAGRLQIPGRSKLKRKDQLQAAIRIYSQRRARFDPDMVAGLGQQRPSSPGLSIFDEVDVQMQGAANWW